MRYRLHWLAMAGAFVGWIAGSVLRIRRRHVERSMLAAAIARPASTAAEMYGALGVSAMEFLWLSSSGTRALDHVHVDPSSRGPWLAALSRGRGVVVAASHTGNWDLAACAMAREVELLVVTKQLKVRFVDRFWQGTRAAQGVVLAHGGGVLKRARETLRRGGAVAMMIDQVPASPRRAMAIDFLGRPALVDRSPAVLAASARCPLVVAAACRERDGNHTLHVLEVLWPPERTAGAWIDAAARSYTRALERFVRAHPSQWLWLHRRWKGLDRLTGEAMLGAPCLSTIHSSSQAVRSKAG